MLKNCPVLIVLSLCVIVPGAVAEAQRIGDNTPRIAIRAARLIDGNRETVVKNAVVLVEGNKIVDVGSGLAIPPNAHVIDLGNRTMLPGLIDVHTHLLLQMDETKAMSQDSEMLRIVATQSTAERAMLGAKLGREDLEAGITTVRELGEFRNER